MPPATTAALGMRIAHYAQDEELLSPDELRAALQTAIEIEHATIPTYLFALYSIQPGANTAAAAAIQSIVAEEMLHMALAANLLNAIGGAPQIDHPGFVPAYPCVLPLGPSGQLVVPLAPCSLELVHDVFMVIEAPEFTDDTPAEHPHTLAAFYRRIARSIEALGTPIFQGDPQRQLVGPIGGEQLFAVHGLESAREALRVIIDQGEGAAPLDPYTDLPPDEGGHELAHYYRFAEVYHGRRIELRDGQICYSGAAVPFDAAAVWPVAANPRAGALPAGSAARRQADYCNLLYSNLLRVLHRAVNGEPELLDRLVGMMFALKLQAQQLMATPIGAPGGPHAGLSFEYAGPLAGAIQNDEPQWT